MMSLAGTLRGGSKVEDGQTPIRQRKGLGLIDLALFLFAVGALVILAVPGLKDGASPFWPMVFGGCVLLSALLAACSVLIRHRRQKKG
jgi:hypothetical protein